MITLSTNNICEYNSVNIYFTYIQGVKWQESNIITIDKLYTGKVETEFCPDMFGFSRTLIHLKAFMSDGKIIKILEIGMQFNKINANLPEWILDRMLLSASPLTWRPYGKFI